MHTRDCTLSEASAVDPQGQPVYRHALGSDAFRTRMERWGMTFPGELSRKKLKEKNLGWAKVWKECCKFQSKLYISNFDSGNYCEEYVHAEKFRSVPSFSLTDYLYTTRNVDAEINLFVKNHLLTKFSFSFFKFKVESWPKAIYCPYFQQEQIPENT